MFKLPVWLPFAGTFGKAVTKLVLRKFFLKNNTGHVSISCRCGCFVGGDALLNLALDVGAQNEGNPNVERQRRLMTDD
jgi:hypothetical protein